MTFDETDARTLTRYEPDTYRVMLELGNLGIGLLPGPKGASTVCVEILTGKPVDARDIDPTLVARYKLQAGEIAKAVVAANLAFYAGEFNIPTARKPGATDPEVLSGWVQ